jgi:hypothetical protein
MDPILHVSCEPEPDAERIIGDGLNAFNDATVGHADRLPLRVLVSDPDRVEGNTPRAFVRNHAPTGFRMATRRIELSGLGRPASLLATTFVRPNARTRDRQ